MFQLLANDLGHFATKVDILHICEDEVERRTSRLFFAMGMIDEDRRQVGVDLS